LTIQKEGTVSNNRTPHPTMHEQPMGVNGLPDDYIDDSDRDDATGGSRDDREPQPLGLDDLGPDVRTLKPAEDDAVRADSVVKEQAEKISSDLKVEREK
jgi:hypothetical protein